MASILEELVIQLRADDGALRSELTKILAEAGKAGDGIGRAFTPGQQALKRLSDEVRAGIRPLRDYRSALQEQERELRATADAQDGNSNEYRQTVSELASVRTELISVNEQLRNQQTAFERVGQAMTRTGSMLSLTVTAPLVAMGTQIVRVSADFESSMNRVRALSGATGQDFDKLRAQARELGATTVFSASEAADAMGFLAMAGFEVEQIYASMPATLSLAAAAQLDMATSADIVSNILTGFNLPVDQLTGAVDVLTKAFTSANTDLGQLGDGMTYVGPIASGLGVSFEETTAALGALSNAGIQGSMAGTSLRRILSTLASDTGDLGVAVYDAAGNMRPLADILDDLNAKGMSTAETLNHFGDRGGPAMQALLTQGGQALRDFTAELENAGGTADEIAKIQMEGFAGQLKELQSVAEELMLSLGDAGLLSFLTRAVGGLRDAAQAFTELGDSTKTTILVVGGIAAGVGPALIVLGRLATAVRHAQTAFAALRTVVMAMSGPAGWIGLGVIAVGALVVKLSGARDSLDSVAERAGAAMEDMATRAGTGQTAFEKLQEATDKNGLQGAVQGLAETLEGEAKNAFITLAQQAIDSGGNIEDIGNGIMELYARMAEKSSQAKVQQMRDLADVAQAQMQQVSGRYSRAQGDLEQIQAWHAEREQLQAELDSMGFADWDVPLENQPASVRRGIEQKVEHLEWLTQELTTASARVGQVAEDYQMAAENENKAMVNLSMAMAEEAQRLRFLAGDADSPFLDLRTYGATVTDPFRPDGGSSGGGGGGGKGTGKDDADRMLQDVFDDLAKAGLNSLESATRLIELGVDEEEARTKDLSTRLRLVQAALQEILKDFYDDVTDTQLEYLLEREQDILDQLEALGVRPDWTHKPLPEFDRTGGMDWGYRAQHLEQGVELGLRDPQTAIEELENISGRLTANIREMYENHEHGTTAYAELNRMLDQVNRSIDTVSKSLDRGTDWGVHAEELAARVGLGVRGPQSALNELERITEDLTSELVELIQAGEYGSERYEDLDKQLRTVQHSTRSVTAELEELNKGLVTNWERWREREANTFGGGLQDATPDAINRSRMEPIKARIDAEMNRLLNRAMFLGEEIDWSGERLKTYNRAILEAVEAGVDPSFSELADIITERDMIQAGVDAGTDFMTGIGQGIALSAWRGAHFLKLLKDGEFTPDAVRKHLDDQAAMPELVKQAERLLTIGTPLEQLRDRFQEIADAGGPAAEQARELLDQIEAFQAAAAATEEQEKRVKSFASAVEEANSILGLTPDRTTATINELSALADEFEKAGGGGALVAEGLRELIRQLEELKEKTEAAAPPLTQISTNLSALQGVAGGLSTSFTRAAAGVANGLNTMAEAAVALEEATTAAEEAAARQAHLAGLAQVINGVTAAVEGLKGAAAGGMNGNDIISTVGGIAAVGAEVIGTLSGIPGLGQVVTAAFGLLNAVIGDLSDGTAEVDAQIQNLTRSSKYMGDGLTQAFRERFTRQVSRGGIVGSFGATKAELDQEAFGAAMDLADSFGSMLEQALRSGDFDSGWNDAILDAMIEAFTMSDEIQQLILDMVEFWNEAWEDGVWSADEDAKWRKYQERYKNMGDEERQRYLDAGLIDEDKKPPRSRAGGSRITDLTGPARDHFSDLLAPLANLGAQLATLQDIRNILDARLSRTDPAFAGAAWANYGPIHITSNAKNADDLMREIAQKLQRQKKGG